MSNPNKAKGTRFESQTRDFLKQVPLLEKITKRLAPTGFEDEGDVHISPFFCLQCKDVNRHDFAGWVDDAELQADRAHLPYGVAVVKRRRKGIGRSYAVMSLEGFRRLAAHLVALEAQLDNRPTNTGG